MSSSKRLWEKFYLQYVALYPDENPINEERAAEFVQMKIEEDYDRWHYEDGDHDNKW